MQAPKNIIANKNGEGGVTMKRKEILWVLSLFLCFILCGCGGGSGGGGGASSNSSSGDSSGGNTNDGSAWQTPVQIDAGNGQNVLYSKLVTQGNGDAICLFQQSDGSNIRAFRNMYISASRGAREGSWTGAEPLDNGGVDSGTSSTFGSDIVYTPSGDAYAVYWQMNQGIFMKRYNAISGEWEAPALIPETAPTDTLAAGWMPRVACDTTGRILCAYARQTLYFPSTSILLKVYDPTTATWSDAVTIKDTAMQVQALAMDIDPLNNIFCIWGSSDLYACRYDAATDKWSDTGIVNNNGTAFNSGLELQLKPDSLGNLYVIARQPLFGFYNRFDVTTKTWGNAQALNQTHNISLDVDSNGNALLIYDQADYAAVKTYLVSKWYIEGSSDWSDPFVLETANYPGGICCAVAFDSDNNACCLYFISSGLNTLFAKWYDATTKSWSEASKVVDGAGTTLSAIFNISLSFDSSNNALCTYMAVIDGVEKLYSTSLDRDAGSQEE